METLNFLRTSINIQQSTRCNFPEILKRFYTTAKNTILAKTNWLQYWLFFRDCRDPSRDILCKSKYQENKKNSLPVFVSTSSNCVKFLMLGAEVIQHYTEVLLELNTFSHIHLLLVEWTDLYRISNYKSQAVCQIRTYWTLQSHIGLAMLGCTIHKCIYNNVYINHSLKKKI
jgi:hypothetical protein